MLWGKKKRKNETQRKERERKRTEEIKGEIGKEEGKVKKWMSKIKIKYF